MISDAHHVVAQQSFLLLDFCQEHLKRVSRVEDADRDGCTGHLRTDRIAMVLGIHSILPVGSCDSAHLVNAAMLFGSKQRASQAGYVFSNLVY